MALEAKVRIWNSEDHTDHNIVSAAAGTSSIVIATDQTSIFVAGLAFQVNTGSNDGWFTTVSSSYSAPNTTIVVNEAVTTTAAEGAVYLWDYITFDGFAKPLPVFNNPHRKITDRRRIVHRIADPHEAGKKRFVNFLPVTILPNDMDKLSSLGKRLDEFFRDYSVDDDTAYYIFTQRTSKDQAGDAVSLKYRYNGYLDEIEGELYGLGIGFPGAELADPIVLNFHIYADGTFTSIDELTSGSARTRP